MEKESSNIELNDSILDGNPINNNIQSSIKKECEPIFGSSNINPISFEEEKLKTSIISNFVPKQEDLDINNIKDIKDEFYERYTITKSNDNSEPKKSKVKNTIFEISKSKKIFSVDHNIKTIRKRGRFKRNLSSEKPKHDKNSGDNITQKVKRHFINNTFNFVNKKYKEYLSSKNKKYKPLLMKIDPNSFKIYSKKTKQEFLNMYLKDFFSVDISKKYSKLTKIHSKDYNKKQISLLYQKNKAKEVIEILNLTIREMYVKYISNEYDDLKLNTELNKIEKIEGEEYKNRYKERAEKFI